MLVVVVSVLALLGSCIQAERECYVDFTLSVSQNQRFCNGSDMVNGYLTEPVILQYRSSQDWISYGYLNNTGSAELQFVLNDSTAKLQLRWIQYSAVTSVAWAIDSINVDCDPFFASVTFEELPSSLDDFWECYSGSVAVAEACSLTESHLLMNGSEREARSRIFDLRSQNGTSQLSLGVATSCRECSLETVSLIDWPLSYVDTQFSFPCNVSSAIVTRTCSFNGSVATWLPSMLDVFNICRAGVPPAGASCKEETIQNLRWPLTAIGGIVSQLCLQNGLLIRRWCMYDGSTTYWYPDIETSLRACPTGTQIISERGGMLANQINDLPTDEGMLLITNFASERDYTYPSDLQLVANLTAAVLDRLEGEASKEFGQKFGSTMSNLLEPDAVNAVKGSSELNNVDYVVSVLELTDRFAVENHNPQSGDVVNSNLRVTAVEVNDSFNQSSVEVFTVQEHGSIELNSNVFKSINTTARVGGVFFSNLTSILPAENNSNYTLESPVFSVTVTDMDLSDNDTIVVFNLTHRLPNRGEVPICAFYNLKSDDNPFWSEAGCRVLNTTATYTICGCDHLTHFAVLFDARGASSKLDEGHRTALQVITYIGVAVSLPTLLISIICFLVLRSLWSLRTFVNINLCATLFIAQLIFVIGADKTSNEAGCATVAILLHYFFLVSFMWMLMEGVVLYIVLIKVFAQINWKYYVSFALLCYGGPLLYMILCIPLGLARRDKWSYGNDDVCWLTYDDHFIWAFIIPVILIIIINIGFLVMAMSIMCKHRDTAKSKKGSAWYWFKGCFSLMISMGITWIFGLVALHKFLLPLIYLFAIFTSLQGLWIFMLLVVLSHPVHEAGKRWWASTVGKSEILSSYYFNKSRLSTRSSHANSPSFSRKGTVISRVSVDEKSEYASSRDSIIKLQSYDSSPKVNGLRSTSISSTSSSSYKETSA